MGREQGKQVPRQFVDHFQRVAARDERRSASRDKFVGNARQPLAAIGQQRTRFQTESPGDAVAQAGHFQIRHPRQRRQQADELLARGSWPKMCKPSRIWAPASSQR